jgi:multisubunit Na+/H+ antiporter MnhB subunit
MPGGGFIAGLMTSTAIVLEYLAFGIRYVKKFERSLPYIFATGLLFALGTGLGAMFFREPFLQSVWGETHIRVFGRVELASAVLFDFGVFLVVVGTTMTILTLLGEEESFE